ncbi:3-oxoacyl-ACP reductase FabG [Pseudonocardiaceae bacterium YIM PH 21723]|nr:3-oxoacyl-ACP reductase FabG [Pseudonocardiaceae bacterium YIM PH 21723]
MSTLTGKIALVTGGSRGIGAAVARTLAAKGADVAITYAHNKDQAEQVATDLREQGVRALTLRLDVTQADEITAVVDETVRELGKLDILVNNAGYMTPRGDEPTLEQVDQLLDTNTRGAYLVAQAAAKHLGDGGRIINLGSILGSRVPRAGVTLYAMSKAAITGLTKGLSRDLGDRGITVNEVAPGPTNTDMNPADGPQADGQRARTALGRYGEPAELAATVAFLASPEAAFITGSTITVDGGTNA